MTSSPSSLIQFTSDTTGLSVSVKLDLESETVWLSLSQMAQLFERDKSVISRHLKKIFEEEELEEKSVVAKNATTAADGKQYHVQYFNLDVILSVGYRVNSKKGSAFRRWASGVLKEHLLKGYSLHKDKLRQDGLQELERALELLKQTFLSHGHMTEVGAAALGIIHTYTKTWVLLNAFDEGRLAYLQSQQNEALLLSYEQILSGIADLKENLCQQKEAGSLFGQQQNNGCQQIWGSIHQTFGGVFLYPSIYERAAHLFYFTIKDHPFMDGNKRIASFLLILYLSAYGFSFPLKNEGLVALTLLIAQSQPQDKDIMIKLILNLLEKDTPCSLPVYK